MASYSPKINDRILLCGHTGRFVIVGPDVPRMTADVRSTSGGGFLLKVCRGKRFLNWKKV